MSESSNSTNEEDNEHSPLLSSMIIASPTETRPAPGERQEGSGWITAGLIMINATLGGGLLNFPAAFDAGGGILTSMFMQIILALLAGFSFILISWLSDLRACTTYQDTVGSVCGPVTKNICSVTMILYTYGSCVAYFIIVGDESDRIFYSFYGADFANYWYLNRKFVIVAASILLILPFCYAKKIDFLKYASGLATAGVLYFVFLTAYVYYSQGSSGTSPVIIKTRPDHWTDIFKIIPTVCFAYQSHLSVVPTYACMEKRSLRPLGIAVTYSTVISFLAYSLVGIYGYLAFGSDVKADILSSFTINNAPVAIGFLVFAVKVFLTYPVMEYVGREALETSWVQVFKLDRVQIILGESRRRFWFATFWFASSLLIGIFVPNILTVIGLLGSFAALFIFVFPGISLLNALFLLEDSFDGPTLRRLAYCISFLYIVLGAFVFGLTIAQFFEDFFALPDDHHRSKNYALSSLMGYQRPDDLFSTNF